MGSGISKKNITEGIPFEAEEHRTTARNNSWTAGTNSKSTEVLGGKYTSEALIFYHRGRTQRLCWTGYAMVFVPEK